LYSLYSGQSRKQFTTCEITCHVSFERSFGQIHSVSFIYITDNMNGNHFPTADEARQFGDDKYSELFNDEAHLLFIFFEYIPNNYAVQIITGRQAQAVIDQQAVNIILDYTDRYYYDTGLDTEQYFAKILEKSAERIMSVTRSPWPTVLVIFIFAAVFFVAFLWWGKAKEKKLREAEQIEKILSTPLETFGDDAAKEAAKKYENK